MKKMLTVLALLLISSGVSGSEEAFPAPNEIYSDVRDNPQEWQGVEVAFEGAITDFTDSGRNTPYFKVAMPQPVGEEIWSALLFNLGAGSKLKAGHVVRVLGYYGPFEPGIKYVGSNDTGYHLLTFCVVNISTNEVYFMPQGIEQCESWQCGELPKT